MEQDNIRDNWLKIVGTGIRLGQMTLEAQQAMQEADVVFSLVAGAPALAMISSYNPNHADLKACYQRGKDRGLIYREMSDHVLKAVREGHNVCLAAYGHPLVFVSSTLTCIEEARAAGYEVEVLPGVSAEDCIFAELEFDPAVCGCATYCATEFVEEDRIWDPRSVLVLWQVAIIGERRYVKQGNEYTLETMVSRLEAAYGKEHPVYLFEANTLPFFPSDIRKVSISEIRDVEIRACCTLVIPPVNVPDLIKVPAGREGINWIEWPSGGQGQPKLGESPGTSSVSPERGSFPSACGAKEGVFMPPSC